MKKRKKETLFSFEQTSTPLLDVQAFRRRQITFFLYALALIAFSLGIGIIGYHFLARMNWIDSFYNAAMILTGMGPASEIEGERAKIFAGCYSLFSGVVFLSTVAVMFTPFIHRFLHRMHLDEDGA
jgi:hypothetical protein